MIASIASSLPTKSPLPISSAAQTTASSAQFAQQLAALGAGSPAGASAGGDDAAKVQKDRETRETFQSVVGETLFGQMLKSMRKTVGKPAYFHGGRGEEVFQQQLDQVLAEKLSQSSAAQFTEPMWELFVSRNGK